MEKKNYTYPELVDYLNRCRDAYYNDDQPLISDSEYDQLFDLCKQMEEERGYAMSISPTQSVGYEVKSKLEKVEHPIPLRSLDKTQSLNELRAFAKGHECLLMLKYDGLTVELLYENGELVEASTRGNGLIGDNITHNAKTFVNIPTKIAYKDRLRLTGEAIILAKDFEEINANLAPGEKPYENQRNLAAGTSKVLDSAVCASRNVRWMLWDIIEGMDDIQTRSDRLHHCVGLGFSRPDMRIYNDTDALLIEDWIKDYKEKAIALGIPIDGMVLKFNKVDEARAAGHTEHHNKDGFAFKFENSKAKTTLRNIEWSIGRTGRLTPVAIFDPVRLDDTTVTRSTIHNVCYVRNMHLHIGDTIEIQKAHMIIPQVTKNFSDDDGSPLPIPTHCPSCGSLVDEDVFCTNKHCPGRLLRAFEHFVSKPAMNIVGIASSMISKFIELGFIESYSDLYHLDYYKDQIIKLEGFGERSYQNMIESIEASRKTTLNRVITAFGIATIGKKESREIVKFCNGDPKDLLAKTKDRFDWTVINGFGAVMSDAINDFFADDENKAEFVLVLNQLDLEKQVVNQSCANSTFAGKTIVVTGSLVHFTRDTINAKIEEVGAKAGSSVSKNTDYLIAGEKAGSKLAKAQSLGVKILTEEEFLKMIE